MSGYLSRMAFEFHFEADDPNGAVAKTREIEQAVAEACDGIGISVAEVISRIHIAAKAEVALARLAAVQDGQTERERHKVEMPDAKREEADEPRPITGLSATPGEGFDSPRSPRSVCPCRVHGDPDGDCGENCG